MGRDGEGITIGKVPFPQEEERNGSSIMESVDGSCRL
jgi:hypothetical protein